MRADRRTRFGACHCWNEPWASNLRLRDELTAGGVEDRDGDVIKILRLCFGDRGTRHHIRRLERQLLSRDDGSTVDCGSAREGAEANKAEAVDERHDDVDVIFASQAARFVPSAGAFSTLLAKLTEHFGGQVVRSACTNASCPALNYQQGSQYWKNLFC